tara:strand:+ start:414 stop:596 length:183 start_codon:yes stop_codon:yes gene_type:complete
MLEFVFGWIIGVWMGQQLPLPSVQTMIHNWRGTVVVENAEESSPEVNATTPIFSGEMPSV